MPRISIKTAAKRATPTVRFGQSRCMRAEKTGCCGVAFSICRTRQTCIFRREVVQMSRSMALICERNSYLHSSVIYGKLPRVFKRIVLLARCWIEPNSGDSGLNQHGFGWSAKKKGFFSAVGLDGDTGLNQHASVVVDRRRKSRGARR
jgi:hypothetical protein